jgi:hypothetical protein
MTLLEAKERVLIEQLWRGFAARRFNTLQDL